MMQAAEDGPRFDAPEGLNWSPRRRILVQGQVCSAPIVVARITAHQMAKMALSQDNHVVQTSTGPESAVNLAEQALKLSSHYPNRTMKGSVTCTFSGSNVRSGSKADAKGAFGSTAVARGQP